jgi:arginine decarboxylase
MDEQGQSHIVEINEGDSVEDMLRYVHLDADEFRQAFAQLAENKLPESERAHVLAELDMGLKGYTYLEDV